MTSYKQIVQIFEDAANAHKGVNTFAHGTIDQLDASAVNVKYAYVFLRPIQSLGIVDNTRTLNFELYCLDVPTLATQSPVDIMSVMEQTTYDMLSYINRGNYQQELGVEMTSLIPVNEAFQDRAYGWVTNISVFEIGLFDYCRFPS